MLPHYWNFSLKSHRYDQHYLMEFSSLFMSVSATCHAQHDLTKIHTEFICIHQSNQISIVFLLGFQPKYFWTNAKGAAVMHEKIHKITCLKRLSMYLIRSPLLTFITQYFYRCLWMSFWGKLNQKHTNFINHLSCLFMLWACSSICDPECTKLFSLQCSLTILIQV